MLANVLRVADPDQVKSHKTWEQEAFKELAQGNDLRLGVKGEGTIIGQNHAQKPKLPGSGLD
jgi:hypothetical protein